MLKWQTFRLFQVWAFFNVVSTEIILGTKIRFNLWEAPQRGGLETCGNPMQYVLTFHCLPQKAVWSPGAAFSAVQCLSGFRGSIYPEWATALFHRLSFVYVCLWLCIHTFSLSLSLTHTHTHTCTHTRILFFWRLTSLTSWSPSFILSFVHFNEGGWEEYLQA